MENQELGYHKHHQGKPVTDTIIVKILISSIRPEVLKDTDGESDCDD
jgi:hypothetical protein